MASEETAFLEDEAETTRFGEALSKRLQGGGLVFLHGDLGAGKTTLARGLLRGLGYLGPVRSPTYTLVERYPSEYCQVCHFDLYRMGDPGELEFLGAREDLSSDNLCLIEWPERGAGWLERPDLDVYLTYASQPHENKQKIGRQIQLRWHNRQP